MFLGRGLFTEVSSLLSTKILKLSCSKVSQSTKTRRTHTWKTEEIMIGENQPKTRVFLGWKLLQRSLEKLCGDQ